MIKIILKSSSPRRIELLKKMNVDFIPGGALPRYDEHCDAIVTKQGYIAVSRVYADPLAANGVDGIQFKL